MMKCKYAFLKGVNIVFFTAGLLLLAGLQRAVAGNADSMRLKTYRYTKEDTVRVAMLNSTARLYIDVNPDSTLHFAKEALTLSGKLHFDQGTGRSLQQLAIVYFHKNDYNSAIAYNKAAFQAFEKTGDKVQQAAMLRFAADVYYRLTNYKEAMTYYNRSIAIATSVNDLSDEGLSLINIGGIYTDQSNYPMAAEYYLQGLKVFEQSKDKRGLSLTLVNLGTVYSAMGDAKKAQEYISRAIPINDALEEKEVVFANAVNIGVVYSDLKDYKSALASFETGKRMAIAIGDSSWIVTCMGNIADVYYHMGKDDTAYALFAPVLRSARQGGDTTVMLMAQSAMGSILARKNKPAEAIALLLPIMDIAHSKQMNQYIFDIAGSLAESYEQLGDMKKALAYHKLYYNYRDSVSNEKTTHHIQQVEFDYQLQKKESQIALQHARNEEQKIVEWSLGGGIVLLIALSVLLYRTIVLEKRHKNGIVKQKEEIQLQAARLEELVRFKDKTFSVLSHDLRGPMGTLTTAMMLLDEYIISPEEFARLKPEINQQLYALNNLLDNLLNWARTSIQGEIVARPEVISIRNIADQNVSLLKEPANRKGMDVINNIPAAAVALCDPGQADIVIRNLISNAVKFTPKNGTITIAAVTHGNRVQISIQDTGVGMTPEQRQALFTAASRNTHGTVGEKGTGLGLLLCYEFIKGNNGTITVTSEPGKGSTFTIDLPTVQL